MQTNKIKCKYQHLIDITYSVDGCWTPLLVLSVMVLEVMVHGGAVPYRIGTTRYQSRASEKTR